MFDLLMLGLLAIAAIGVGGLIAAFDVLTAAAGKPG